MQRAANHKAEGKLSYFKKKFLAVCEFPIFEKNRSETPISAMGEDSNHSVMSDSQDGTEFSNKINPSSSGPTSGANLTKES